MFGLDYFMFIIKGKYKLLMLFEMNAEKGNYKDVKVYMI